MQIPKIPVFDDLPHIKNVVIDPRGEVVTGAAEIKAAFSTNPPPDFVALDDAQGEVWGIIWGGPGIKLVAPALVWQFGAYEGTPLALHFPGEPIPPEIITGSRVFVVDTANHDVAIEGMGKDAAEGYCRVTVLERDPAQ